MSGQCFSYTSVYLHLNSSSYQHVAPSASAAAAACPCRPCRRLPRSCVSVWSAHTRWKEPLWLGWSRHSCATELRKTGEQYSKILPNMSCVQQRAHDKILFEEIFCQVRFDIIWTRGYLFHPGVFSRDWHTVESLSLCSHSVFGVKIHLEIKHVSL